MIKTLHIDQLMDPMDPSVQSRFGSNGAETLKTMMNSLLSVANDSNTALELSWHIDGDKPFLGTLRTVSEDKNDFFEMTGLNQLPLSNIENRVKAKDYKYKYEIKLDQRLIQYNNKSIYVPIVDSKESVNDWDFLDDLGGLLKQLDTRAEITLRIKKFNDNTLRRVFFDTYSDAIVYLDEDNQFDFNSGNESIGVDLSIFAEDQMVESLITEEKIDKSMSTMNRENLREIEKYREKILGEEHYYCHLMISAENLMNAKLLSSMIPDWLFREQVYRIQRIAEPVTFEDFHKIERPDDLMQCFPKKFVTTWFNIPVVKAETPKAFNSSSERESSPRLASAISAFNLNSGKSINLDLGLLSSHTFISGATGQGKTKTIYNILNEVHNNFGINFLILEAAKKEYRGLKTMPENNLNRIKVITPGSETLWPLRINLFEPMGYGTAQYDQPLIKHIYLLEKVFRAALPMPSILPMILLKSLKSVYSDKGWKILEVNDKSEDMTIPTIHDLLQTMDKQIQSSTYSEETKDHIRAMFDTRFSRLSEDLMGQILFGETTSPSWDYLFNNPVLIELDGLHDDNINLIAIFIIMMLYEYRKLMQHQDKEIDLKHLLILEEAHVILSDESIMNQEDAFNPKLEASKLIEKLLSEIRALGEGIIISDQAPSCIPQGVLRNTRTKIIHQISDPNDKATVKSALGLNENQVDQLGRLQKGNAFFVSEGYNYPIILRSVITDEILNAQPIEDLMLMKLLKRDDEWQRNYGLLIDFIENKLVDMSQELMTCILKHHSHETVFKEESIELKSEIFFELAGDVKRTAIKEYFRDNRCDYMINFLDLSASLYYQTFDNRKEVMLMKIDQMRYNLTNLEGLNE